MATCPDCNQKIIGDGSGYSCGCTSGVPGEKRRDDRYWIPGERAGRYVRRCRALVQGHVESTGEPITVQCPAPSVVSIYHVTTEVPLCLPHAESYWREPGGIALVEWLLCSTCGYPIGEHLDMGSNSCLAVLMHRHSLALDALKPLSEALNDGNDRSFILIPRVSLERARDVIAGEPQGVYGPSAVASAFPTDELRKRLGPVTGSWRPSEAADSREAPTPTCEKYGYPLDPIVGHSCDLPGFDPSKVNAAPYPTVPPTALRSDDIDERGRRKASPDTRYNG